MRVSLQSKNPLSEGGRGRGRGRGKEGDSESEHVDRGALAGVVIPLGSGEKMASNGWLIGVAEKAGWEGGMRLLSRL